jgi:hypothetical protein
MARVSAGQIGVMSLPEKNLLLRFPIGARHPMLPENNGSRFRDRGLLA